MRLHRSFALALVVAASVTLLAVACSGDYNESTPTGPTAVGGVASSVGGVAVGGGTISLAGGAPIVAVQAETIRIRRAAVHPLSCSGGRSSGGHSDGPTGV